MKITVIGLGHLGTVASGELAAEGHVVTGLDVDERRVQALQDGRMPFYEPGLEDCVTAAVNRGNLRFLHSDDMTEELAGIALVTAGTPRNGKRRSGSEPGARSPGVGQEPGTQGSGPVNEEHGPAGQWPGVSAKRPEGACRRLHRQSRVPTGGSGAAGLEFPDRIVLGADSCSGKAVSTVRKMYSGIEAPFLVTDITSAEMIKYATNAFLATRISFMNEMAAICDAVGASVDAVSEGLALDERTGNRSMPGSAMEGHAFQRTYVRSNHLAHSAGSEAGLLRAVAKVNHLQRQLPLKKLDARFGGCLEGLQVGVLGLAFKPGTDDVREAASLELIRGLVERGARVRAFDPQASAPARELLPPGVEFVDEAEETAACAQALILLTEWRRLSKRTGLRWRER